MIDGATEEDIKRWELNNKKDTTYIRRWKFFQHGFYISLIIWAFGLFFAVFCKAIGHFFTGKILGLVYIKNGKMMPEISPSTSTHTSLIFFNLSNTIGGIGKHSHVNTTLLYIPYPIKIRKK